MTNDHQPFFLDIAPKTARDPNAPYAVFPLPYERTVTYGTGTVKGPTAILCASHEIEDFDEELMVPMNLRVQTLQTPIFENLGDKDSLATIRDTASSVLREDRFLLSLGGEHTVTYPLTAAVKSVFEKISVLHIDAHLDLRDQYEGTPLSHACVMRRVRDIKLLTIHVGVRSCSADEYAYAEKEQIPIFWAKEIHLDVNSQWVNRVITQLTAKVYVTVDIDALDPSLVPGTGTPEPGGLYWRQITGLLREVFRVREVIAADIVEVAPIPGSHVSEFVAARLGAKMLMYHKHREKR